MKVSVLWRSEAADCHCPGIAEETFSLVPGVLSKSRQKYRSFIEFGAVWQSMLMPFGSYESRVSAVQNNRIINMT